MTKKEKPIELMDFMDRWTAEVKEMIEKGEI